jgi:hypothetical protein
VRELQIFVIFEELKAVTLRNEIVWVVTPFYFGKKRFGGTCCLHLQGLGLQAAHGSVSLPLASADFLFRLLFGSEDGGNIFL